MGRGPILLIWASAWGWAGCIETVKTELDVGPGDLVILVSVDDHGHIQEVKSAMGGGLLPELGPRSGEHAYAAVLPRDLLVGPDGLPLDEAVRRSLVVGVGPRPASGCGRCLFSSPYAPMVIHGGSSCPVPEFASWRPLGSPLAGGFAERPWIAAPGQCACRDPPIPEHPAEVDYRLVDPPDFFAAEAVAMAVDGTVGLFSESRSLLVLPDGARISAERLFAGPVLAVAPALDGSFWVASHEPSGAAQARRDRIAAVEGQLVIVDAQSGLPLRPASARALGASSYFLGQDLDKRALAQVCGLRAGGTECNILGSSAFNLAGERLVDAAVLDDGAMVLLDRDGVVVLERQLDESDDPQATEASADRGTFTVAAGPAVHFRVHSIVLASAGPALTDAHFARLAPIAGGAIACASNGGAAYLIRLGLDRSAALDGPSPTWTILGQKGGYCLAVSPDPDDPSRVRVSVDEGVFEVDALGTIRPYDDPRLPPIERYDRPAPGSSLAVGRLGEVYRTRAPGQLEAVHTPGAIGGAVVAILGRPDDLLIVEQHRIRRYDRDQLEIFSPTFPIAVSAATLDPSGGVWLASGRRIYFVEPQGGPPLERMRLSGTSSIAGLAYVGPERFLAYTRDYLPELIADGQARPFSIVADDPSTQIGETTDACGVARSLSVNDGVGWYAGCQAQLYRAHPFADPPVLQRVGFERASQVQYRFDLGETTPKLASVAAVCPDRVFVAASGQGANESERGRLWALAPEATFSDPAPAPAPLAFGDLTLRDLPQSGGVTELDSDLPIALIPGLDRLDLLFEASNPQNGGSIHAYAARARTRFADPPTAAGWNTQGMLVGTREGRLYRQVPAAGR